MKKVLSLLLSLALLSAALFVPMDVSAAVTKETYVSLLDLSGFSVGTVVNKGSTNLPAGFDTLGITANTDVGWKTGHGFNGTQKIVENNGKKSWQLQFDVDFNTANYYCDITNELMVKIAIPVQYRNCITKIACDIEGAFVRYCFGVTDGTNYGINTGNWMWSPIYGALNESWYYNTLDKFDAWGAFDTGNAAEETWGDDAFDSLFLNIAGSGAASDDYARINDIGIYVNLPEDEPEIEPDREDVLINDFETNGTATEFAAGGSKAKLFQKKVSNRISGTLFTLKDVADIEKASAVTFWVYNTNNKNITANFFIAGDLTYMTTAVLAANDYTLVKFNIASAYVSSGNVWETSPSYEAELTAEQKKSLGGVTCALLGLNDTYLPFYVDSVCLEFRHITTSGTVDLSTADNGRIVGETLVFDSSSGGSNITARIPVPRGSLKDISNITLNMSADVAANVALAFEGYSDEGYKAHWKFNYHPASFSVAAGSRNVDYFRDFYAVDEGKKYNANILYECSAKQAQDHANFGCWDDMNDSGKPHNPPSSSEKAGIDTIVVRVFDNVGSGTAVTLNSITFGCSARNTLSVTQPDSSKGSVSLGRTTYFSGEKALINVNVNDGYYLERVNAVDDLGRVVDISSEKPLGTDNIVGCYSFTVPSSNVAISADISQIDKTLYCENDYSGTEDYLIDVKIPLVSGAGYNENDKTAKAISNFGIIVTSGAALEKYGFTANDLTYGLISQLSAKKHNLCNNTAWIDSAADGTVFSQSSVSKLISLEIKKLSAANRRKDIVIVSYVNFADGSTVNRTVAGTPDELHYGEKLMKEFDPNTPGINVTGIQSMHTATYTGEIFRQSYWDDIYAHGFRNVRLPINVNSSLSANGTVFEDDLEKLDAVVDLALQSGVCLAIDMHGFAGLYDNFNERKDIFEYVWQQIANRYSNKPLSLVFQLLNEPSYDGDKSGTGNMTVSQFMNLQSRITDNIHSIKGNEERIVVLGTSINGYWNFGNFTAALKNKKHIIVDCHHYNPMTFTHSGASGWQGTSHYHDPNYDAGNTEFTAEQAKGPITSMAEFERTTGIPVWMGEFGAYRPDYTKKCEYLKIVIDYAKECGIGWAIWFSPYENGVWDEGVMEALGL